MATLDVRPLMASGNEPFDAIMSVVGGLEPEEELKLFAPLDPVPLYQVMAGDSRYPVRAGDVIVVPAGEVRGLRAIGGRLVAVNVVSPPSGSGDHSHATVAWPADDEAPDLAVLILTEHAGLFPHLPQLGSLAADSAGLDEEQLRERLQEILRFLRDDLLPQAAEEERSVYPAVEKVIRAIGGATRTMTIDHRFIGGMVEELEGLESSPLSEPERERVRRLLYGLETLLEVHFTKENEAYVPLLNRLSAAERRELHSRLTGGEHGDHEEG